MTRIFRSTTRWGVLAERGNDPALSYPVTPFLNGPGTVSAHDDDRLRKDMYVSQWGISIQQALPARFRQHALVCGQQGNLTC